MALVLDPFDLALLENQENKELDEQLEREIKRGWGAQRKYNKMLGQGKPGKRPVIPVGNIADPKCGVWVRFAPVRHPLDPPCENPGVAPAKPLGIWSFGAYVHWMEIPGDDGKNHWRKTICCGDTVEMDAGRSIIDPERCPSCAWAYQNAEQNGLEIKKFVTPGIAQLKRYFLVFNESAYADDLTEWINEGLEQGYAREEADFVQPLWLLEISSGPLLRDIRDMNLDADWGRLFRYRVRLFWTPTGKGDRWEYHIKMVGADVQNEHRYLPFTPAQRRGLEQYNTGTEVDGEVVAIPDVTWDCYPWPPEDHKRTIYGNAQDAERKVKREEDAERAFADNPVASPQVRAHVPVAPSPVAASPVAAPIEAAIAKRSANGQKAASAAPAAPAHDFVDPFQEDEAPTPQARSAAPAMVADFEDEAPSAPAAPAARRTPVGTMPVPAAGGNIDF